MSYYSSKIYGLYRLRSLNYEDTETRQLLYVHTVHFYCSLLFIIICTNKCIIYRVIQNDCWGFNNLSYTIHEIGVYVFFYLTEQHSKFLLHTLQVLCMCTLCDSANQNCH